MPVEARLEDIFNTTNELTIIDGPCGQGRRKNG
jgi:hypothetical protein